MRNLHLYISLLALSLSVVACVFAFQKLSGIKQGYVVSQKIFDGFNGKKSLEKDLTQLKTRHKNTLDSLLLVIRTTEATAQQTQQLYLRLQAEFEQSEQQKAGEYTEQIWKQINQYVKDYGKKEGYDYILGADGRGSLMYANEGKDISEEVLIYINSRYEGNP